MASVAKSAFAHLKWLEPLAVLLTPDFGRPLMADLQIDYELEVARAEFRPTRSTGATVRSWQIVGDAGPMWFGSLDPAFLVEGDFVLTFGADDVPEEMTHGDIDALDAADVTFPAVSGDWAEVAAATHAVGEAAKGVGQAMHDYIQAFTSGEGQLRGRRIEFRGVLDKEGQIIYIPPESRSAMIGNCPHDAKCRHRRCLWCAQCAVCAKLTRPAQNRRVIAPLGGPVSPPQVTPDARPIFDEQQVKRATLADPCKNGHMDCAHGRCFNCEDCDECNPFAERAPF